MFRQVRVVKDGGDADMHIYGAIYLFLVFIGYFDFRISGMEKWDELVTGGVIVFYIFFWRRRISRRALKELMALACLVFIGLLGNIKNPNFQPSTIAKIKDIVAVCKFPLVMILLADMKFSRDRNELISYLAKISRGIAVFSSVIAFVGYVIDIGVYTNEIRYFKCLKFFYIHPTFLVASYVLVLSMLIAESIDRNRIYIALICIVIFLAQRTKGYVMILLAIVCLVLGDIRLRKMVEGIFNYNGETLEIRFQKALPLLVVMLTVIGIVGGQKIQNYLSWGMTAARPALYLVGIQLAKDFFPIGSGLGTFASWLSGEYYSNVYSLYKISHLEGIRQEKFNYLADVFWPNIYGQYGIMGLLVYVHIIYLFIIDCLQNAIDYRVVIAVLFVWVYILFASTAEAFFMSTTGLQYALFLGLFFGGGIKEQSC